MNSKQRAPILIKLSSGSPSQIFFTPAANSAVCSVDKQYAVFLQESELFSKEA